VRRTVRLQPAGFGQRAGVALVGLNFAAAGGVHRGEVGVGDNNFVPQPFEVTGDPLTPGARLDQDVRARAVAEQFGDVLVVGLDAPLDQFAVRGNDADLAGDLAEVEADEVHSWFCCASRSVPQNVRSSMLPSVAASRFIQSFLFVNN
jgi:hypothetical protein